jgi:hypothetical protein
MTHQAGSTLPIELLERIASDGFDFLPEPVRILINAAMQIEQQEHPA